MSDRELLELAAKAAGYSVRWYDDSLAYGPTFGIEVEPGNPCGFEVWNPLTDDGDALRLAVKLSISIDVNGIFVHADCRYCKNDIGYFEENSVRHDGDIMKATRIAIVRAAASLGEQMP